MEDNRKKALGAALSQIERQFGKGAVMKMGDQPREAIPAVSTGSLGLDVALGIGGLPYGRICEIYGPESSGKTTLTLQVIAEAQKAGKTCAFVDAEHALDPVYAEKLGVNVDELLVSQPDTGEQALEISDMLVRSNAVDVIIVDSVAALTPKAEIEGEMGDSHVGLQARLMSQALRKLTGNVKHANCLLIFDEVQTSMGRTGTWFGYQQWGVQPDIMTMAKGIAGGVAAGAFIATEEVAPSLRPGMHASTFGGNPLAMAAGLATGQMIEDQNLLENCQAMSDLFRQFFEQLQTELPLIREVRVKGMMIGVELNIPSGPAVGKCMERGLLINSTHDTVLRLLPPLNVLTRITLARPIHIASSLRMKTCNCFCATGLAISWAALKPSKPIQAVIYYLR